MKYHGVIVDMLVTSISRSPSLTAIFAVTKIDVGLIDGIKAMRITVDLLVVVRAGASTDVVTPLLPALTAIFRSPETAFLSSQFDRGINDFRTLRRDLERDLAFVLPWKAFCQCLPRLSTVDRFENARL